MLPDSLFNHLTIILLSQYANFHSAANVFFEILYILSLFVLILKLTLSIFSISDISILKYQSLDIDVLSFMDGVFSHNDSKFL